MFTGDVASGHATTRSRLEGELFAVTCEFIGHTDDSVLGAPMPVSGAHRCQFLGRTDASFLGTPKNGHINKSAEGPGDAAMVCACHP